MSDRSSLDIKKDIIDAGRKAAEELIQVARSPILGKNGLNPEDELAADKMKNAAAAKKLCIFDAFDILQRVDEEEKKMEEAESEPKGEKKEDEPKKPKVGFGPESRAT